MSAVVFLGPSLPRQEAAELLPDATILPPARQSDVITALTELRPSVIALVDGEFHQARSVWHKELLHVLAQGVPLYGCSSMGALRAAELAAFGMRGRGEVFARYASGELVDDDEVALAYHQEDGKYRAMSEPMVNIRATVTSAVAAGVISAEIGTVALMTAKNLEYPQRHRAAVLQGMRAGQVDKSAVAALTQFWRDHAVDIKAEDARSLLRELRDGALPPPPALVLVRTESLDSLIERERRIHVNGRELPLAEVADYVQLHHPDRDAVTTAALDRGLALTLATLLNVRPTESEIRRTTEQWRRKHRLVGDDEFAAWLTRNHLSSADFDALALDTAKCQALHRWLLDTRGARGSTALLLDSLRWSDRFEQWADSAAESSALADAAESRVPLRSSELDVQALAATHELEVGVDCPADDHSGFLSPEELARALTRAAAARAELRHRLQQAADLLPASTHQPMKKTGRST
ncbi:TfuA-like protein [Actinokineospora enzanensis]|uniref:TfuA-like protein n=1 Tax=Actinokineospora enzanensis TaxID=155975 RepID=UPI00035DE0BE|nr:TfuA-like protein [Actinokineospora enzanensis]